MNISRFASRCGVVALLALSISLSLDSAMALQRGPPTDQDGVEVLTRGPVHEAFAGTITFDPQPGVVVQKYAPEAIEELPPEQQPEGANVDWIPGYWAWDDERNDFLWVSGIWRSLPPGRQWVSGYWTESGDGSQWISGYWADAQADELEYLPEPPATVEEGPNVEAPSPDDTWLPGCWLWQHNRFAWRPGYWAAGQSDWDWVPAHYVWTPRGYVFVDAYYDYSVARRGVLFAPVYFTSGIFAQSGFSYSPSVVISTNVFGSHLFLRPSYGHYYFGDYYGSSYAANGYSPWFSFHSNRFGYDPFYAHQRWHHRNDRDWRVRLESDFAYRNDHEASRPPRTWKDQRNRGTREASNNDQSLVLATPLDELAKDKKSPLRFKPLTEQARQQLGTRAKEVRSAGKARQELEAKMADPSAVEPGANVGSVKVKRPRSPIAGQPIDKLGSGEAPPKAIGAPVANSKIEPKPRKPRGNAELPLDPRVTKPKPSELPKLDPTTPKTQPKPELRKTQPSPDRPKLESKPPKAQPKPDRPKANGDSNGPPKSGGKKKP